MIFDIFIWGLLAVNKIFILFKPKLIGYGTTKLYYGGAWMHSKIKVLLTAENDEGKQLVATLYLNGMEVYICQKNGAELLRKIHTVNPDVVIMDAFMRHIDGLGVLTRINTMNPMKRPLIFVLSCFENDVFKKTFLKEGADYCFVKPVEPGLIAERISQMFSRYGVGVFANKQITQELEIAINEVLYSLGISAKIKGFRYLREAIRLVVEKPEIINNVTRVLYPMVAERFNSNPHSVERDMRYAVKLAWDKGNVEMFQSYPGCVIKSPQRPTNSEFIARVSDDLRFKRKMHMKLDGPYKSVKIR